MQYDDNAEDIPSVLLREFRYRNYNGVWERFYLLNISPVGRNESREFKIKFLAPCHMYWDVRRIYLRSREFYNPYEHDCSTGNAPAEFLILDHDHPNGIPGEVYEFPLSWTRKDGYWYTKTGPKYISYDSHSIISFPSENSEGNFMQVYQDGDDSFYQLSMEPGIELSDVKARNIIILFDLTNEYDLS